jgi:hypothetical protein
MARREEWLAQVELSCLLDKWIDPVSTFVTAVDNVASSAMAGLMRRRRGVKAGLPDTWVVHHGKLVGIEMKSRSGRCTPSQRAVREALLRAGADWWECRSAHAAMWALRKSGVRFRSLPRTDGTTERWRQPRLAPWEVPRRDPAEPRPRHPEVISRRRAARRRWLSHQQRRETSPRALEPRHEVATPAIGWDGMKARDRRKDET